MYRIILLLCGIYIAMPTLAKSEMTNYGNIWKE